MYADYEIKPDMPGDYLSYIPQNYHEQINKGELTVTASYEGDMENGRFVGILVSACHDGWLEIVWVAMGEEYRQDVQAAEYLRHIFRKARRTGSYKGVFCEIHMEEETALHRRILALSGMELIQVKNNIYELKLSELMHRNMLYRAAESAQCRSLEEMDKESLAVLEKMISEDERPIPVKPEIEWDSYDSQLSQVFMMDGNPSGLLLFSVISDYLVLELAYSSNTKALPAMLGAALIKADERLPKDQKVLIPIVGQGVGDILERLTPEAKRGDSLQAVMWFEEPGTPPPAQHIIDRMLNINMDDIFDSFFE